jgi:hypothetical protein
MTECEAWEAAIERGLDAAVDQGKTRYLEDAEVCAQIARVVVTQENEDQE